MATRIQQQTICKLVNYRYFLNLVTKKTKWVYYYSRVSSTSMKSNSKVPQAQNSCTNTTSWVDFHTLVNTRCIKLVVSKTSTNNQPLTALQDVFSRHRRVSSPEALEEPGLGSARLVDEDVQVRPAVHNPLVRRGHFSLFRASVRDHVLQLHDHFVWVVILKGFERNRISFMTWHRFAFSLKLLELFLSKSS